MDHDPAMRLSDVTENDHEKRIMYGAAHDIGDEHTRYHRGNAPFFLRPNNAIARLQLNTNKDLKRMHAMHYEYDERTRQYFLTDGNGLQDGRDTYQGGGNYGRGGLNQNLLA